MVRMMTNASADRMEAAVENRNAFTVLSTLMIDDNGHPYRIAWSYVPKNDAAWTIARSLCSNGEVEDGLNWVAETDDVQIIDSFQDDVFEFLDNSADAIIEAQAYIGMHPDYLCTVVEFTPDGYNPLEEIESMIEPQDPTAKELAEIFKA